jgi:undecaprenyl-diphosphatase
MATGLRDKAHQLLRKRHVDGVILLTFFLVAVFSFLFMRLASEMVEGDTLAFDQYLIRSLRNSMDPSIPAGPAWLQAAMLDITSLGGVAVLTVLTVIVAGYLVVARKTATALFLVAAISAGATASVMLKALFVRPRPDLVAHLVQVDTTSFPSGHAMTSAVVYLTLGALLARAERGRRVRTYLIAIAVSLTIAVGFSRVYLGVHWPSDVLAGWCVGAAWAALCSIVARVLQRGSKIEQPTSTQDPG